MRRFYLSLLLLVPALVPAQNYQCNWSVVDLGGGALSSTSYRSNASAGQTAVGQIAGTNYQAFIGFWQIDTVSTGVREESHWSTVGSLVTALLAPAPNPFFGATVIPYSLAGRSRVAVRIFDATGRAVRTLVDDEQNAGNYTASWNGRNDRGRALPTGVYFCRMRADAGNFIASHKLMLLK